MLTDIDTKVIISIINAAELEDALILENNYRRILSELPDGVDKVRVLKLRRKTRQRIKELTHGV